MEEEQCGSCDIVIGKIEEHSLSEYRGHLICSWCQAEWKRREELAGRELSWEEFISGKVKENKEKGGNYATI